MTTIAQFLAQHYASSTVLPDKPATDEQIAQVEAILNRPLPLAVVDLLRQSDGLEIRGTRVSLSVYGTRLLDVQNEADTWSQKLNGMFVFANDGASNIYYLDVNNRIGRGAGHVYAVDMSICDFEYSVDAAPDIVALLERVLAGEDPAIGTPLGKQMDA